MCVCVQVENRSLHLLLSGLEHLREFIKERLTTAAEEILSEFEKTIVRYEEEISQLRLLDIRPGIKSHNAGLDNQQVCDQERSSSLNQENPEPPQTKEEQEEMCSSEEGEQLELKQEDEGIHVWTGEQLDLLCKPGLRLTRIGDDITKTCGVHYCLGYYLTEDMFSVSTQHDCKENEDLDDPQVCSQERNSSLDQQDKDPPQTKEEQEEISTNQEEEQLALKQETKGIIVWTGQQLGIMWNPEVKLHRIDFPQQDCKDENPLVLKQDTETFPAHEESDHSDLEPSSDQLLSQNPLDTDQDESKESYRNKSEQIVSGLKVQNHKTAHLCSTCGKKCNKMEKLNRHEQIHTGEKPRSCSICGKRFSQKSHSKQHMPVHTGEKLHSCGTCGKRFSRKSVLTRHMLIHTGEKQHSCRICGNGFSRKEHLNRHMEFHTNEKQYSCSTRGKRFNVKSNLNIHMRIRKGKNIYSQRAVEETHVRNHTCGKQFSSSVQLKMLKMHI
ncbi:unnamed protein product [Oreochromis niloticus]|nr:unnamed protein product [Mustela putorius furo]